MEMAGKFLEKMYRTDADFVFTVTRDSVRQLHTNWSLQELQCDAFEARWRALRSLGPNMPRARQASLHDQTTRRVLTAAADLATVCTALGRRAHRRAGGRAGLKD